MAGRPLSDLDPSEGPIAQFAADLRKLRTDAGEPTLESMARRCGMSRSVLSEAMGGRKLPSEAVTSAFVRQCRGSEADVQRWLARRREVIAAEETRSVGAPSAVRTPQAPAAGVGWRWAIGLALVFVLAGASGVIGYAIGVRSAPAVAVGSDGLPTRTYAPVRTGADPSATGCAKDATVGASITEPDGTVLELVWSDACQANWGRITRTDNKTAGNTLSVTITGKFDDAPNPQTGTATDQQSTYTPLMLTGSDKKACVTGTVTTDGKEYELPDPACG